MPRYGSGIPGIPPRNSLRGRLYALFLRSEPVRGFALLSPTLLIMLTGMCIPFAILVAMSFWTQHVFEFDTTFSLTNYNEILDKPMYRVLLTRSLAISGACTVATLLLAYPMAYYVAFHVHRHKMVWIVLITLPFWSSYLLRVFAWKIVLGYNGAINSGFVGMGWIQAPLAFLLYSPTAVVITLTHAWAAFAILPIYVSLEKIDRSLLEAATDLGDGPVKRFTGVTLPLSVPGIIAASLLIFIPVVGDFVTPALVIPGILLGVALLLLISRMGIAPSLYTVTMGHILITTPFAMATLIPRFEGFDKAMEEASADLGANAWSTFWRVTLPMVFPGVVASLLLCFTISFDEFIIAFMLAGTDPTLPIFMYSQLRFPARLPPVVALGSIIIFVSFVVLCFSPWLRRYGVEESVSDGVRP